MRRTLVLWAVFVTAMLAFSGLWGAARDAWSGQPTVPPARFLLLVVVFLGTVGYLTFAMYAAERAAGRVRRRIALFDRILERRDHGSA